MSLILGIDPGSQFTGFGIVEVKPHCVISYVDHGVIEIPRKLDLGQKLNELALKIAKLYEKYDIQETVVENIFLGKNVQSAFVLGHVRGVSLQLAAKHKSGTVEYAARTVKKAVTGNGGATKDHVKVVVQNVLGIKTDLKLDATDALALCICRARRLEVENVMKQVRGMQL